jgi:hypothetical protein
VTSGDTLMPSFSSSYPLLICSPDNAECTYYSVFPSWRQNYPITKDSPCAKVAPLRFHAPFYLKLSNSLRIHDESRAALDASQCLYAELLSQTHHVKYCESLLACSSKAYLRIDREEKCLRQNPGSSLIVALLDTKLGSNKANEKTSCC